MHRQKHMIQYSHSEFPVADKLYRQGVYLPLYPALTDEQVGYICDVLIKACAIRKSH